MSTSEVTSPVEEDERNEEKIKQDDTAVEPKEQPEKKETTAAGDSASPAGIDERSNKDTEEKEETVKADDKAKEDSEKMMEEATNGEKAGDAVKEVTQQAQSKEEEESVVATTTVTEGETDQERNTQLTTTSASTEEKQKPEDSKTTDETSKLHTPSQDKEREKHKDKRKKKRKSRGGAPKLRRRSSKADTQRAEQSLTNIFLSYFQELDPENNGLLPAELFWGIVLSQELNLQLTENDLVALQGLLPPDNSGMISYAEFVVSARTFLVTVYEDRTDTEGQWVEVRGIDGTSVMLNKKTGAVKDLAEGGFDLFEDTIRDLFKTADTENKGYVTVEDFTKMLAMQEMTNYLQAEDIEYMTHQFPDGKVTFSEFYPIAKELILRVYRTKDSTEAEWLPLSSPRVGLFWFNKFSGETRREMSPQGEREQELMLINQLNAELEACRVELEQEKLQGREWQNQLALANEELERMAVQLDETGQRLDDAHNELAMKEVETAQFHVVIDEKEQFIADLQAQVVAAKELEAELTERENALKATQDTVIMKEQSLTERDEAIATLQHQSTSVVDQLKSARGVIDARDSTITRLQRDLAAEQARLKELEDHVPLLEKRLGTTQDELKKTRATMEEKAATLIQTRRHLKNAKEKNKELETDLSNLSSVHDKLQNAESEIKALKQFVTSKTAMVERRKAEIVELKAKLVEAESKDNRRAIILADVLEKTARSYQQQLASSGAAAAPWQPVTTSPLKIEEVDRPCSAPHLPMEEVTTIQMREKPTVHEFSLQSSMPTSLWPRHSPTKKTHLKAKTVPKLPPIRRRPPFMIPTEKDIHTSHRKRDFALLPHVASNPECQCQLCLLSHPSAAAKSHKRTRGLVGGMMGGEEGVAAARYQQQLCTDETELNISQQIKLGIRVLLQTKKSVYDLEPQKLTGVVKYVGKIDSEFLDNRIYVGVRLDEPVGNTDGLFKGKRYFTCTSNHGKMVRITNIIAVLPPKSVVYRPINLSPYASKQQQITHKKGALHV